LENLNANYILIGLFITYVLFKIYKGVKMKPLIKEYLNQGAVVVDVRSPEEFAGGHCEGSINMPLNVLEARYLELKIDSPVIVCCASGGRSGMAMSFLQSKGYGQVVNAGAWSNVNSCKD
jgi:phage shock protein E